MKKSANYFVWRRSDGYVACTRYHPDRIHRAGDTFEMIAEVETWAEAKPLVEANRDEKHYKLVRSWDE